MILPFDLSIINKLALDAIFELIISCFVEFEIIVDCSISNAIPGGLIIDSLGLLLLINELVLLKIFLKLLNRISTLL